MLTAILRRYSGRLLRIASARACWRAANVEGRSVFGGTPRMHTSTTPIQCRFRLLFKRKFSPFV